MTFEELKIINFGKPSIGLLNEFIKEQEAINIFYKTQFKKDKRPYWKGKMGSSTKMKRKALQKGVSLYGDMFDESKMGLSESEKQSCWDNENKTQKKSRGER